MNETVDHEARKDAVLALQQIQMHVKHCDDAAKNHARAQELQLKSLDRVHARIDGMNRMAMFGMGTIALGVLGILLKMIASGSV